MSRPRPRTTSIRPSTWRGERSTGARSRCATKCSGWTADVDVDQLQRAAERARRERTPAAYRAALSLYGGELLPENRYDDWAAQRREELAELAVELTAELAELDGADGPHETRAAGDRPFTVPTDPSSFVGRHRELSELRALLARTRAC